MTVQTLQPAPAASALPSVPEAADAVAPVPAAARPVHEVRMPARGDRWGLIGCLICALALVVLHLWDFIAGLFR